MIKYLLLFIFCLFAFNAAFAQKRDTTVYYLKNSGKVLWTKDGADFILTILPPDLSIDKDLFVVKEYYPDGKVRCIGNSKTNKLEVIDPNSPDFYRPVLIGDETEYYPNGKLYCTKTHTKDKKLLCNECRDSTGKVLAENGNGKWLTFIDERFKNCIEGNVSKGFVEGEWYGKRNDTINFVYQYKNGELKSAADIDKSGQKTYWKLEVVPEFRGGRDAFYKYLGHNIHYPANAKRNWTQGRVIVQFVVEANGTLNNVKVVRGIGDGCDEEAVRVIKLSPPWKPGYQDGNPVRVQYSLPITYSLER